MQRHGWILKNIKQKKPDTHKKTYTIILFIKAQQQAKLIYNHRNQNVVALRMGLARKKHKVISWGDKNVLCLKCGYIGMCNCPNTSCMFYCL